MCQLVTAFVHHLVAADHEAVFHHMIIELCAGIGMSYRDLNGFDVQLLGERDRIVDSFARLAGKSKNEIAMNDQAKFVAVLRKLAGPLNRSALLDVLQNL